MVLPFFPLCMYWENEKGKAHVHTRARPQASGQKQKEWDTFEQIICFTLWWDVWYNPRKTVLFICKYMQRQQIFSFQKKQSPKGNKKFWVNKQINHHNKTQKIKTNNHKEWPLLQLDGKLSIFLKRRWKMTNGGERVACCTSNHYYLGCQFIFKI